MNRRKFIASSADLAGGAGASKRSLALEENKPSAEGAEPQPKEMSESEIDKSLMDSFPASDPPPWTLGTEHRVETTDLPPEQSERKK